MSGGWKDERQHKTAPQDLAYAKAAGVMFDPLKLTHNEVLQRLIVARDAINAQNVSNAFLVSLSSRRLELRSALGSYAVFRHLTLHSPVSYERQCRICGLYLPSVKDDLNVLNFERFKWGGVRHDDPLYAMLDLELFQKEDLITPTSEDIALFRNLLTAIETAPTETTAAQLQQQWSGLLRSNKAERDVLVAILGFCGILETSTHQGYRTKFIANDERELPNRHFVDMAYPACWWTKRDGINTAALQQWFGHVL